MQPRGEASCYIAPDGYLAWHKVQVEKKVGRELEDRGYVPKWPEVLPRDFALSYRDQNGKDQLIWISPDGGRYVANKKTLDNMLAGSGRATTIKLPQLRLLKEGHQISDLPNHGIIYIGGMAQVTQSRGVACA